jgi:hypothetical protein
MVDLEKLSGHTPGPWSVWDGPSYVGGGRDLCIGAGEDWLANMAAPECRRPNIGPDGSHCALRHSHVDICVIDPEITAVQEANARLIAAAPELLAEVRALRSERDALKEYCGSRCNGEGSPEPHCAVCRGAQSAEDQARQDLRDQGESFALDRSRLLAENTRLLQTFKEIADDRDAALARALAEERNRAIDDALRCEATTVGLWRLNIRALKTHEGEMDGA